MKTIVFGRRPKVYLPEIKAYTNYIERYLPEYRAYDSYDLDNYDIEQSDIVWRFMGFDVFDIRDKGRQVIHEYNSLSAGYFARTRNEIKKSVNKRPHARIFLNRAVKKGFSFQDNIPCAVRDMGVDKQFFIKKSNAPLYDFIYAGSLDRGLIVSKTLEHFKNNLKGAKLLVVGEVPKNIFKRYGQLSNITFTGRVPYTEVPELMAQARFGLNLMPDVYPFNAQTATKVLEYCAVGIPVVTTNYKWVRRFCIKKDAKFFNLRKDLGNLTMENLEKFSFVIPDVQDYEWNTLIKNSGVFDLLK